MEYGKCDRSHNSGVIGQLDWVESSHLQSPSPRRKECGNHTHYFSNLLRVTVRVNAGASQGHLRTRDRRQIECSSAIVD